MTASCSAVEPATAAWRYQFDAMLNENSDSRSDRDANASVIWLKVKVVKMIVCHFSNPAVQ